MSGFFLVFDGLDGTGKSTQCRRLTDWLVARSIPTVLTRDPGGTELAMNVREIVLNGKQFDIRPRTEVCLFGAARADLVDHVVLPGLNAGKVIISDRYSMANIVYQGHAGGLNPDAIRAVELFVTAGVEPHLTLVFDLPVDEAAKRRKRSDDRMEAKGPEYLDRVRAGFLAEALRDTKRTIVIDASGSEDEIFDHVLAAVGPRLTQAGYRV
jgi:dTMP kinase